MSSSRLSQLQTAMVQAGLDAVALNPGPTFTYLTGVRFHLMERPVVLLVAGAGDPVLVLPEFEAAQGRPLSLQGPELSSTVRIPPNGTRFSAGRSWP